MNTVVLTTAHRGNVVRELLGLDGREGEQSVDLSVECGHEVGVGVIDDFIGARRTDGVELLGLAVAMTRIPAGVAGWIAY